MGPKSFATPGSFARTSFPWVKSALACSVRNFSPGIQAGCGLPGISRLTSICGAASNHVVDDEFVRHVVDVLHHAKMLAGFLGGLNELPAFLDRIGGGYLGGDRKSTRLN